MGRNSRFVEAAKRYIAAGFKVLPVVKGGKQPALPGIGSHDATDDIEQATKWFARDEYNIGITAENMVVIDVDVGKGKEGHITFANEVAHLLPKDKPHIRTGGDGSHYILRAAPGVQYKNSSDWKDVDVKTVGGYIVAPPSVHESGREYKLISGDLANIPMVPKVLHDALKQGRSTPMVANFSYTPPTNTTPSDELMDKLRADRSFRNMLEGTSLARKGARDNTLFQLASRLVRLDDLQTHPTGLAALFTPSLQQWITIKACEPLEYWTHLALDKITRCQADYAAKKAVDNPVKEAIAEAAARAVKEPLIIQKGAALVFRNLYTNTYHLPVMAREWRGAVKRCWPRGHPDAQIMYQNDKGDWKEKTLDMLLRDYVELANMIIYTYEPSKWDPVNQILNLQVAIPRVLNPEYSSDVEGWLNNLFPDEYREDMLNWLACVPAVEKPLCAAYLVGPARIGKTLLKEGLSQLWNLRGGVAAESAFDKFNEPLLYSPLIFLDEGWTGKHEIDLCLNIRETVGGASHSVEMKGLPKTTLSGFPRMIVIANDDNALASNETKPLSEDAHRATEERILYVRLNSDIVWDQYPEHATWIENYTIPKHILWLKEQRFEKLAAAQKSRFIVEGRPTRFHKRLGTSPRALRLVLTWFLKALRRSEASGLKGTLAVGPERIAISPEAITNTWRGFDMFDVSRIPDVQHLHAVLQSLSTGELVQLKQGPALVLDEKEVIEELERLQLCSESDFKALLKRTEMKVVK